MSPEPHDVGDAGRFAAVARLLFLASGMCALMDEVLWARALSVQLGNTYRTHAFVIGIFFAALPFGAALGARWTRRLHPRGIWIGYAACEGAAAAAAFAVAIFSRNQAGMVSARTQEIAAYAVLAGLAIPGLTAGATWPLMAALSRARPRSLGSLYALNTLGGALGALLASFWLVERLGTSGALFASSALGAMLAVTAVVVWHRDRTTDAIVLVRLPAADVRSPRATDWWVWCVAAISGFLTIAFELLTERLLALRLATTSYSIGLVLTCQLAGMAFGAALAPAVARSGRRGLSMALAAAALGMAAAPVASRLFPPPGASHSWALTLLECFGDAALISWPGAVALGVLFPLSTSLLVKDDPFDYARIGLVAMASGVCGMIGALTVGVWVVPTMGVANVFALLIVILGLSAGLASLRFWKSRIIPLAMLLGTLLLAREALQWQPTHLDEGEQLLAVEEGPVGIAAVIEGRQGVRRLVVNGRHTMGDSASRIVARRLALLPALLAKHPADILLLGLGTGMTEGAAREIASVSNGAVEVAEFMPEITATASYFSPWQARFGPRATRTNQDGRTVLRNSLSRRDLVIFDVVHPWLPGAGSLYTEEAFVQARSQLKPGGVVAVWVPAYQFSPDGLASLMATFSAVFPRAHLFAAGLDAARQVLALVSEGAQQPEIDERLAPLRSAGVLDDPLLDHSGALMGLDLGAVPKLLAELTLRDGLSTAPRVQHDDRPWLEFESARSHVEGRSVRAREFRRLLEASEAVMVGNRQGVDADVHSCLRAMWLDSEADSDGSNAKACFSGREVKGLARQFAGMLARRAAAEGNGLRAREIAALATQAGL